MRNKPLPRQRRASPSEIGFFMFFAWPTLLAFAIIKGFFWLIGKLLGG